jgi:hypothetical protein
VKLCQHCNQVKPFEAFYASSTHKSGYASWCIVCEKKRNRIKNQGNKERRLATAKSWRDNNKEKSNAAIAAWREANAERYAQYFVEYRENNRAKVNAKWMKRYTAKKNRTPNWLTAEQFKQIETEYALAEWCSKVMGEPYHVDHIVPLQGETVSGLHVPWNLQVITAKENRSKSNALKGA